MATRAEIWYAAQSAVRDEVRRRRPRQHAWTAIKPSCFGLTADGWLLWSRDMVTAFNAKGVKPTIAITDAKQRSFFDKPMLDFAKELRDA